MANTIQSWTGTKGVGSVVLSDDWDQAKVEVTERCAAFKPQDIPEIPPAVALRIWDFFKTNFPDDAYAVVELYLDS